MRSRLPLIFLIGSTIAFILSLLNQLPVIPERIATHFDIAGHPNGWLTCREYLTGITVLGLALPGFAIGICHSIRLAPPSKMRFSEASYWSSQEQYLTACRLLVNWSYCFGGISFLWVTLLNYQLIEANRLSPPHLAPGPVLILSGAYVFINAIIVAVLIVRLAKVKAG